MNEQIEKYFLGELAPAQKDDLFKQIAGHPDLRDEFVRVQNSWALAVSSAFADDRLQARRYLREFKKWQNRRKAMTIFYGLSKYAAILVIGMLIAKMMWRQPQVVEAPAVAYQTLTVTAGQRAHITLPDGSAVWVNPGSTLEYPGIFMEDTRELTLTGEAYFEVAENPEKPFIVKSGNFRTKVTGTKFNVFAHSGFYDVTLVEGQVKVYEAENANDAITLNRNEKVTLTDGILVKKVLTNTNDFLWKEGIYYFDDMPFAVIVEKLQMYYDVRIHVTNKALMKYRFTGKFRQRDGIENVLKVIQMGYPFVFSKSEDDNNIYIK